MVNQVCRSLGHATGVARWANTPAFAGKRHKVVAPTVITTGARKAVGKDAAFEIFAKCLADIDAGCMVVALAVKLADTGQLKPSLKILADSAVQQGVLRVTRVIEFGFDANTSVRVTCWIAI